MTHPGVGPLTGLAFALVIGPLERFRCGKQIGSYLGLIPCEDSSAANNGWDTSASKATRFPCVHHLYEISTALRPPRKVRLRCLHRRREERGYAPATLAKRDTAASTLIQATVTVCTRWIRRMASGEAICSIEAIHDITALYSHASRSKTSGTCRVPLADPQAHRPRMRQQQEHQ